MTFLYPYIFWLAVIVPLLVAYYIFVARREATLTVSTIGGKRAPRTLRYWLRPLPFILRMAALVMFIIALARPVEITHEQETTTDGIDIVLSMDTLFLFLCERSANLPQNMSQRFPVAILQAVAL